MSAPDTNGWMPIETAPKDGTLFIGYGGYQYPDDTGPTTYTDILEYSGDPEWPWRNSDSLCRADCYSHWQHLPKPPVQPVTDTETMAPDTYTGGNFNGVVEGEL